MASTKGNTFDLTRHLIHEQPDLAIDEPIFEGVAYRGQLTLVSGETGLGKTNLLVGASYALSSGEPRYSNIWDISEAARGSKVLYVDGESNLAATMKRAGFVERPGDSWGNLRGIDALEFVEGGPLLALDAEGSHRGRDSLLRLAEQEKPALIVFDSASTLWPASTFDLARPGRMNEAQLWLLMLARRVDAAVMLLGHTNQNGTTYGGPNRALWATNSILLSRDRNHHRVDHLRFVMSYEKCRNGHALNPMTIEAIPDLQHLRLHTVKADRVQAALDVIAVRATSAGNTVANANAEWGLGLTSTQQSAVRDAIRQGEIHGLGYGKPDGKGYERIYRLAETNFAANDPATTENPAA